MKDIKWNQDRQVSTGVLVLRKIIWLIGTGIITHAVSPHPLHKSSFSLLKIHNSCTHIHLFCNKDPNWSKMGQVYLQSTDEHALPLPARNAIVVVLAAVLAGVLSAHGHHPFELTPNITAGLPEFKPPSFHVQHGNVTMGPSDVFAVSPSCHSPLLF